MSLTLVLLSDIHDSNRMEQSREMNIEIEMLAQTYINLQTNFLVRGVSRLQTSEQR